MLKRRHLLVSMLASAAFTGTALAETRSAATFEIVKPEPVKQDVLIPPLLGPNDLKNLQTVATPYIIDVRNAQAKGKLFSYAAGHIPNSVNVPYGK